MSCVSTQINFEVTGEQLRFSHSGITKGSGVKSAHILGYRSIFDLPTTETKTAFVIQGVCEGTGKLIQTVYEATWDNVDILNSMEIVEASKGCCPKEATCYDSMLGISLKDKCNCLTYPLDAHVSKSGYYLDSILNLSNVIYSESCDFSVWEILEQTRKKAVLETERLIGRCLIEKGMTEKFDLKENIGKAKGGGTLIAKDANYISTTITPRESFHSSTLNVLSYFILPFFAQKNGSVYSRTDTTTSLWIKKDGEVIHEFDVFVPKDGGKEITCDGLIELNLDEDSYFEFVLSLWGRDLLSVNDEGTPTYSEPYRIYTSNNIQYKTCCGSTIPNWASFVSVETKTFKDFEDSNNTTSKPYSVHTNNMGGVYFDVEGSCSLTSHICRSLGASKSMLYQQYAKAALWKWAVETIDYVLINNNPVTNTLIDLSRDALGEMMATYNMEFERMVGYYDDSGKFIEGEICKGLFNKGFNGSCFGCSPNTTARKGHK